MQSIQQRVLFEPAPLHQTIDLQDMHSLVSTQKCVLYCNFAHLGPLVLNDVLLQYCMVFLAAKACYDTNTTAMNLLNCNFYCLLISKISLQNLLFYILIHKTYLPLLPITPQAVFSSMTGALALCSCECPVCTSFWLQQQQHT